MKYMNVETDAPTHAYVAFFAWRSTCMVWACGQQHGSDADRDECRRRRWAVLEVCNLGHAHGVAGRWPNGFEDAEDWEETGLRLDELAASVGMDTEKLFELYQQAHSHGARR